MICHLWQFNFSLHTMFVAATSNVLALPPNPLQPTFYKSLASNTVDDHVVLWNDNGHSYGIDSETPNHCPLSLHCPGADIALEAYKVRCLQYWWHSLDWTPGVGWLEPLQMKALEIASGNIKLSQPSFLSLSYCYPKGDSWVSTNWVQAIEVIPLYLLFAI